MKHLPDSDNTLLIRTDFSDEAAWRALQEAIATPNDDGFLAYVDLIDDPAYRDLTTDQIVSLAPGSDLLIVADGTALTTPGMQLLAVQPWEEDDEKGDEKYGELRVVAEDLWVIENNISIGNVSWEEYVDAAGENGVYGG
ncbi:DUF6924 domain-containing protein [Streptomyces sp. NPDC048462]|uniref:DUF6924 domain-containing protein n=1 Tax=Streptomyces sp. NPDC048462 TaxID=3365555 RepID=UPI0037193DC0